MMKTTLLFLFLSFPAWATFTQRIYPPLPDQKALAYVFTTIEAISSEPVYVFGDINDWHLDQEELDNAVDSAFLERGLHPFVRLQDYNHIPFAAFLQIKLTVTEKVALVEVELIDDASLLRTHAWTRGVICQERTLINGENITDAKMTILFYIKTFTGKILDTYLKNKNIVLNNE